MRLPIGTQTIHKNHHFHHQNTMGHTAMMEMAYEVFENYLTTGDRAGIEPYFEAQGLDYDIITNDEGDVLLIEVTRWNVTRSMPLENFTMRFAGHDAALISIWCPVAEATF